ncbi:MmgE/PrpD family protein [Bordetella genomosp. 9]|uniref:MmgE/PrpD family protein n=1 Tax=Bordetella genomosp. 9 TaxID=1416803 RepID=UPI000A3221C7|nr:MmgE/PrpD family protein [Bordetella genomosp. 9]
MHTDTMTTSMALAQWVDGLASAHIPPAVRQVATTCILDTLAVAVAGAATPAARAALALCPNAPTGPCTILGRTDVAADAPLAAFVNATAAHALDFDDNCYAGFVHGSAVIVPALLACAESMDATGEQTVTALVAGAECEYAIGAATQGRLYERGWWTTGVLGPIGAAMAAAKLFRLDPARTREALALAVSMASGTKSCFGSDAKPLMAGKAAQAGVQSACLAQAGATGPADPFGAPSGFAARFNEGVFDGSALASLGRSWYLLEPGVDVKRIPVCLSSHAAVDALRALMARHRFQASDVKRVTCDVPPIVAANLVHAMPATPGQARFSMPFAIAMTLLDPDWGLAALHPAQLARDDLRCLMRVVHMETGPAWNDAKRRSAAPEGAVVRVTLTNGAVLEASRDKAAGSAAAPLPEAAVSRKFHDCTAPVIGARHAATLLARLRSLDGPEPIRAVFDILRTRKPAAAPGIGEGES